MAIAPTGNIFKTLEFDGESSSQYGVYISGEGVFNAPERDVEMVTIPGRNGAFPLDNGRFQNIEITYPAGIFADTDMDFAQAISDFRNFLCSRKGYVRLSDDYNPTEYRMAIYKSGLDVTPAQLKAGKFEITFQCKPQRYLMSGESAIPVTSGETLMNPTLFESHPMLEVTGYGSIGINGETISVQHVPLGETQISDKKVGVSLPASVSLDVDKLNTGDHIYQRGTQGIRVTLSMETITTTIISVGIQSVENGTCSSRQSTSRKCALDVYPTIPTYANGTGQTTTTTVSLAIRLSNGNHYSCTYTVTTQYTGANNSVEVTASRGSGWPSSGIMKYETKCIINSFYGNSTKTALPTPMYIDLDIGEAYGELFGERMSLNNLVSMPAELPVLDVGTNTITFDNTVTDLKIAPRWWRI